MSLHDLSHFFWFLIGGIIVKNINSRKGRPRKRYVYHKKYSNNGTMIQHTSTRSDKKFTMKSRLVKIWIYKKLIITQVP